MTIQKDLLKRQAEVLSNLASASPEFNKICSCAGYWAGCRSYLCPVCLSAEARRRKYSLIEAVTGLPRRVKMGTFLTADAPLSELRYLATRTTAAFKKAAAKLKIFGAYVSFEASTPLWDSSLRHGHLHVALDAAPSGRRAISKDQGADAWADALPTDLLPSVHSVQEIQWVQSIGAMGHYLTKSPFANPEEATEAVMDTCRTLKGVHRHVGLGTLHTAHCAA